ncbi:FMN-dependent NADH-azoreductase [Streptomyces sp. KAU_LT]|uniref:FMN-dependent NADH-azoreductase n=1 Tax=Streptomyces sp. KAU_LT TaxID=3046669 RepID=UPI0024B859F1|nr:NAD(P)H-dependent oxidoreductase [Streptomyces sp. KAU_LT]MDI9832321.1 NAD(P)H-dependent oxidoreductase [Streptomyces sp. KAU_LT]
MATLLHIDSSVFPAGASSSRTVTEAFRRTWEEQHPDGTVIHRDLAAQPVPHISAPAHTAAFADPATHTPEQAAAFAERVKLVEELEAADAVLVGAPMYNLAIPSTLKAWLDNVIVVGRTVGDVQPLKGTPVTVVASRGGAYGPGSPREGYEYVQNYLSAIFKDFFGADLTFIVPELTMAPADPKMAELVPLFEASRERALDEAATRAKSLVQRLAA